MTLLDDLNSTADILANLNALVTTPPVVRGGPRIGSSGHSAAHLPINAHALDTVRRLTHRLNREVIELKLSAPTFPDDAPGWTYTAVLAADWLAAMYRHDPDGFGVEREQRLLDEYATARAVIDGPADAPAEVSPLVKAAVTQKMGTAVELEELTAQTGERVKASTIRVWATRGKIRKYTFDGSTLYLLGEVLACAAGKAA
ncbi:hypothetical protein [Rhodococcus sp. YH1]|uniref:hypothetical protein n=1 Tax=Rhodococcus sp. YH1 TaxID=89066 RepID=UPI001386BAAE|nr:hypothetical protein [Rhodococcus sp. YH1]NCL78789.1 hypothetical protein [Rhodococcus sp. YH1]